MLAYLIACPLAFLGGLVDSIAGGGGLISLPAYLLAGIPPHMALGTNKLGSSMGTIVSTARFAKNGYLKGRVLQAVCCAVMAMIGSTLGARVALLVPESVVRNMIMVVLPIVAAYVLFNKNMGDNERTGSIPPKQVFVIGMIAAFFIGGYDGFYGPGTGTFLILVLTGVACMDMRSASAQAKVINLSSNVAALVTFILNDSVNYSIGLAAGVCCIAGHYLGSGMVVNNGQKIVRPVVLIVLGILFAKVLIGG